MANCIPKYVSAVSLSTKFQDRTLLYQKIQLSSQQFASNKENRKEKEIDELLYSYSNFCQQEPQSKIRFTTKLFTLKF